MNTAASVDTPRGLALMLGWRRVLVALVASLLVGLILSPTFTTTPAFRVVGREMFVGLAALLAFGLFEQWPARLPSWMHAGHCRCSRSRAPSCLPCWCSTRSSIPIRRSGKTSGA